MKYDEVDEASSITEIDAFERKSTENVRFLSLLLTEQFDDNLYFLIYYIIEIIRTYY